MIAVIFEAWPAPGARMAYLDVAAALRPELVSVDGFVSVERFASLADPGKLLSLSFWRDEAAVAAWRGVPDHRTAQRMGRAGTFIDYRIRIAGVIRDYGLEDRAEAPADSRLEHGVREGERRGPTPADHPRKRRANSAQHREARPGRPPDGGGDWSSTDRGLLGPVAELVSPGTAEGDAR